MRNKAGMINKAEGKEPASGHHQPSMGNPGPERKAAMVSNLLVVLCGESDAKPVINAGTLYG
jgi:hypothetical protein